MELLKDEKKILRKVQEVLNDNNVKNKCYIDCGIIKVFISKEELLDFFEEQNWSIVTVDKVTYGHIFDFNEDDIEIVLLPLFL